MAALSLLYCNRGSRAVQSQALRTSASIRFKIDTCAGYRHTRGVNLLGTGTVLQAG